MDSKDEVRRKVLELRSALTHEEILNKSAAIFDGITKLEQYHNAAAVIAYVDYKNEVMTREFIKKCRSDGKRVGLPKVMKMDGTSGAYGYTGTAASFGRNLVFYEIDDIDRDTSPGYKGIIEPDSPLLKEMDPAAVDLAVIPGVAFDYCKNRLGYGAGYYDRFLPKLRSDCLKIGIAFDLQLFERIPAGVEDFPLDMVITEESLIK